MHKFNIFLPNLHSIRLPVCVRFFLYLYIFIKNKFYGSRGASAENLVIQISLEYIKMASIHIAFYYKLASNHTLIKKKTVDYWGFLVEITIQDWYREHPPPPGNLLPTYMVSLRLKNTHVPVNFKLIKFKQYILMSCQKWRRWEGGGVVTFANIIEKFMSMGSWYLAMENLISQRDVLSTWYITNRY